MKSKNDDADADDVPVTAFFAPSVRRDLKKLAAESGRTVRMLLAEAIGDLFAKYGKRRPAALPDTED